MNEKGLRAAVGQREGKATHRQALLLRSLTAARRLCAGAKRETKGVYRIQPELIVGLCVAVDEAWDCVNGVEK